MLDSSGLLPGSEDLSLGTILLILSSQFFKALGIFVIYDLLKEIHLIYGLYTIYFSYSICLFIIQKPFDKTRHERLEFREIIWIFRQSLFRLLLDLGWFYGLTLCGPLRAILVTSHQSTVITAAIFATFISQDRVPTAKIRGLFILFCAILSLLFLDHDDNSPHHQAYHEQHVENHREIYTFFTHVFSWTDISDHKGGVILLALVLILTSAEKWSGKRAAVLIGGIKRLEALIHFTSTIILTPWISYHYFSGTHDSNPPFSSYVFHVLFAMFGIKLFNFYSVFAAAKKVDSNSLTRWRSLMSFVSAFILAFIWTTPIIFGDDWNKIEDHQMSPGVIFAFILFCIATISLTSNVHNGARGVFVGYSASGLPLYNLTTGSINEAGQSVLRIAKDGLKQILDDSNSRRIFYFLALNLFFTFVEFAYGVWTNSLGLISDGFHMLFDCSALVMGLYAAVLSRWKPTKSFPFGYGRLEILSGFVNGIFLCVIALNVFKTGVSRLFDPPEVGTDKLLFVSVGGLLINLIGIFAFSHGDHGSHGHSHNVNMQGVFLHVLADTLGSVGVIISSILIQYFGWNIADPICSIFIAVLIFISVVPLIKQSSELLLLKLQCDIELKINESIASLPSEVIGILSHRSAMFWPHTAEKIYGTISVKIADSADEQYVIEAVSRKLESVGVDYPLVQVEKSSFYSHIQYLGSSKFI